MNVIPKNESVCFFKLQFYAQIKKKREMNKLTAGQTWF